MQANERILAYYNLGQESARLSGPSLERLRTESILRRFLPAAPATILDIGGADGVYAFPLAQAGYRVHLVDPIPLHVQQAQRRSESTGIFLASITEGDARSLRFDDSSANGVLYLGPLYHLSSLTDRLLALREAHRTLKSGRVLIAAFISKYASLLDGLARNFLERDEFAEIVKQDLKDGRHRNPTNEPMFFTDAQFHHPKEARSEIQQAGFKDVRLLAIEGPAWLVDRIQARLEQPQLAERILSFIEQVEEEEALLGASGHFLGVARK